MKLVHLTADRFDETVAVYCDAFHDYPVMRYVIGNAQEKYDDRLQSLIGYFTEYRFSRDYPVLGIESVDGCLVAAASINPVESVPEPPSLQQTYDNMCAELGEAAINRYKAFVAACDPFEPEQEHVHIGMIGVIGMEQGNGHARRLMDAVHEMSRQDQDSCGVSLTTELSRNLSFYEHFGYRILGRGVTPDGSLETWTLFRPDEPGT